MEGIQVVIGWEVHTTPLGVSKWDGGLGVHPRGQYRLFGHLCLELQSNVECGPPRR